MCRANLFVFSVVFLLGGIVSPASAASPTIGLILPRGAQRGTVAEFTISGANLADTQEAVFYGPGLTIQKLEVLSPSQVKLTVQIAPDCRLGEHPLRLRTATGISSLSTLWIGHLPTVDEKEPNTEFDQAQPIPLNVTVHGLIQNEDADYFVVDCKKGQRLSVEVEGMRLGNTLFDPYVAILDSRRFELATGDDSPNANQDGGCSIIVPADGKYFILVRESSYGGNGASYYRLHVGTFPRPKAVLPAGGKPGETISFRFLGDPKGDFSQTITLPTTTDPFYRLRAETEDGLNPTGFPIRIIDLPNTLESGSNTTLANATPGPVPGAFHGVLTKPGETDYFKFTAKRGQLFDVHCYARAVGSPLDSVLQILNSQGQQLAFSDDASGTPDSATRWTAPADGDYIIAVRDHLGKGGPDYFYRVEVAPIAPSIEFAVIRADPINPANQDRQSFAIPRGGRFAQVLTVNRRDTAGPLQIEFPNLPPGVTAIADTVEAGQSQFPVVFEAAPDAPISSSLITVQAKPIDPKQAIVPSRVALHVALIVGSPAQTVYHGVPVDRFAVAVTEPPPFSIEVIEPKAAISQESSINLKVVARRVGEFKGPITIQPLWIPPGIGIAATATIPEGQTETTLSMNAAGNAAPRKWRTAILATANTGNGQVWTSSQMFTIEVAPAMLALTMERSAVEQGQATDILCKLEIHRQFEGKAKVKLVGLPLKATAPDLEITNETKELLIPVSTDKTTPAGKHRLFCQIVATVNGQELIQRAGATELRVDVPLPPKPMTQAAAPPPPPQPTAKPPEPKRLSRLEQLRLEQEAREKAEREKASPSNK